MVGSLPAERLAEIEPLTKYHEKQEHGLQRALVVNVTYLTYCILFMSCLIFDKLKHKIKKKKQDVII